MEYKSFQMVMEKLGDWQEKTVLVIGAARQGIALASYLVSHGAKVIINDQKPAEELYSAKTQLDSMDEIDQNRIVWACGGHPLELLDGVDLVCPSGGVPLSLNLIVEARARGIPLSNDSQIFLEGVPCDVVGITGSAGKTTTTALVGQIAERTTISGKKEGNNSYHESEDVRHIRKVWVGGNIGKPLLSDLEDMLTNDLAILELSSFQLEIMTKSPRIAAILNLTPNHLDRHESMENYISAKQRILDFQGKEDYAILSRDDDGSWKLIEKVKGKCVTFGFHKPDHDQVGAYLDHGMICMWDGKTKYEVIEKSAIKLRGEHNISNVLAACAICLAARLPVWAISTGITEFRSVPHRLEFVRSWRGADWYNDSIATAPERSMAAMRSFTEPIVLLAGGRDKELPWDDFARLVQQRVDHLILFGEAAQKISTAIGPYRSGTRPYTISLCKTMRQAVEAAVNVVEPGDIVLLAPGGTSFDEFRDFEERGEAFTKWVNELV